MKTGARFGTGSTNLRQNFASKDFTVGFRLTGNEDFSTQSLADTAGGSFVPTWAAAI
jgi:hypothetical protein